MAAFLLHYLQSICTDVSRYIPLGPELSRLFSTSYYVTHQAGPVMGLRPLRGPPCIPPEAPPKKSFQMPLGGEGTRLALRELPSLAALA